MSKKAAAMPSPVDRKRLKDRIVENVSKAVKQIQEVHFCATGTSTDLVFTNQDWQFCKLVEHLDHAFLHGLRHITNGYWVVVQEFTHKATVKEIKRLTNVTTNLGRGRSWLYLALMDHLLESYLRCFTSNIRLIKKYYVKEALVLDQQRMEILLTLAAGLEYMSFQLEVDVPYLDLSSHMRNRTTSLRREISDDQLSLCSMDSSMSQSSSMNTEGQGALGDLMEISSHGSSFDEASSSFADAAPKFLVGDSLHEETRERTERLSHISANVTTPDPMNPADLEVIHVKAKLHRSKKRASNKKKAVGAEGDPERSSLCSLNLTSPEVTSRSENHFRNGEEAISLDEAQEVFASDTNTVTKNCKASVGEVNSDMGDNRGLVGTKRDSDRTKCDSAGKRNEKCDNVRGSCVKMDNSTKSCDRKTVDKSETGSMSENSKSCSKNGSNSSTPKHCADDEDLNCSFSIYDSPTHQALSNGVTMETDALPGDDTDNCLLLSGEGGVLVTQVDESSKLKHARNMQNSLDVSETQKILENQELFKRHQKDNKRVFEEPNVNFSSKVTPISCVTNNDSGFSDCDGQTVEEGMKERMSEESSPETDDRTLISDLEKLRVTESERSKKEEGKTKDGEDQSEDDVTSDVNNVRDVNSVKSVSDVTLTTPVDITAHNSPVRSLQCARTLHHSAEIKVDNNLLLLMMLSIFKSDGEQFIKLFRVTLGHMEGEVEKVALLITSHALYVLTPAPRDVKYTVYTTIEFKHIDYLSLSLNYQSIQIVGTNRRNQYWITTGDWQLTRCIVGHLDIAMRESDLNLSNLTVLTDSTNQKIALKKWVARECKIEPSEVRVSSYILGHWEDRQTDGVTIGACREGALMYKQQQQQPMKQQWKPGYFMLKNGVFYQYEDSNRSSPPISCIKLNGEECTGCRRIPQGERPYSFELVLNSATTLQMAASSTTEQQEWLQSLCQAVSEGMGHIQLAELPVPGGCLPCCVVITDSKILLSHEDAQTNFFRTLAAANVTDVSGVEVDPVPHNYVLVTFEGDTCSDCEKWTFYFSAEDETEAFIETISSVWKQQFQVDLPRTEISDLSVLQHCREVLAKLAS